MNGYVLAVILVILSLAFGAGAGFDVSLSAGPRAEGEQAVLDAQAQQIIAETQTQAAEAASHLSWWEGVRASISSTVATTLRIFTPLFALLFWVFAIGAVIEFFMVTGGFSLVVMVVLFVRGLVSAFSPRVVYNKGAWAFWNPLNPRVMLVTNELAPSTYLVVNVDGTVQEYRGDVFEGMASAVARQLGNKNAGFLPAPETSGISHIWTSILASIMNKRKLPEASQAAW